MRCDTPVEVPMIRGFAMNRKYANRFIQVPCGKCPACLKRRQNAWTFRLMEEAKSSQSVVFGTFTYKETPLSENGLPTLVKKDFQDFMKRLRKKHGPGIKYYACGEYGGETFRPHYHAIIFNLPNGIYYAESLEKAWQKGLIHVGTGTELSIKYVTKYMMKGKTIMGYIVDEDTGEIFKDDRIREFSLMSKGLGQSFMTEAMVKHCREQLTGDVRINGMHIAMPRYYRDKIFSLEEKMLMRAKAYEDDTDYIDDIIADTYHHERVADRRRKANNEFKKRNKL